MGASIDFEKARNGAPEHATGNAGDEGQGQMDEDRQTFKVYAHSDSGNRAEDELTRRADVEQADLKSKGDRESRQDQGNGFANRPGPTLAIAECSLEQSTIGSQGIIARQQHDDCAGKKRSQQGKHRDEEGAQNPI